MSEERICRDCAGCDAPMWEYGTCGIWCPPGVLDVDRERKLAEHRRKMELKEKLDRRMPVMPNGEWR